MESRRLRSGLSRSFAGSCSRRDSGGDGGRDVRGAGDREDGGSRGPAARHEGCDVSAVHMRGAGYGANASVHKRARGRAGSVADVRHPHGQTEYGTLCRRCAGAQAAPRGGAGLQPTWGTGQRHGQGARRRDRQIGSPARAQAHTSRKMHTQTIARLLLITRIYRSCWEVPKSKRTLDHQQDSSNDCATMGRLSM